MYYGGKRQKENIMSVYDLNKTIKEALLDYDNIKKYYDPKYPEDYKDYIFNDEEENIIINYNNFVNYIKSQDKHHFQVLYSLLPIIFYHAQEYDFTDSVVDSIIEGNNSFIFATYAMAVADDIINEYEDFVNDIVNNTTAKKIAISKLKRNKLVNEGILLKLSMKNCGMF